MFGYIWSGVVTYPYPTIVNAINTFDVIIAFLLALFSS